MRRVSRRDFLAGSLSLAAAGFAGYRLLSAPGSPATDLQSTTTRATPATVPVGARPDGIIAPYVDPSQLHLPWPDHSYRLQPWRGYLDSVPATRVLTGIGIVWNLPDYRDGGQTARAVCKMLASQGVSRVRLEVPWSNVAWDESRVAVPTGLFDAFATSGLRPIILLNANDVAPCPFREWTAHVTRPVARGATTMFLDSVSGLVEGYSGLSHYLGNRMADPLVVHVDPGASSVTLSAGSPRSFSPGQRVTLATLKYRPFNAPGTPDFEATMGGWLRYVDLVGRTLRAGGVAAWDWEVWNELSFGSQFLNLNSYYSHPVEPKQQPPVLAAGGKYWEIAARTQAYAADAFPAARVLWGFSSVSWFHTPVQDLPPGIVGQTEHPYATVTHFPRQDDRGQPNVDHYVPTYTARIPESKFATFIQTESIIRLLQPAARTAAPPSVAPGTFHHYITEHGFEPHAQLAITDAAQADRARAKFLLRNVFFWLNKGVEAICFYAAYAKGLLGYGYLNPDALATPPGCLIALGNAVRMLAGADSSLEPSHVMLDRLDAYGSIPLVFAGGPSSGLAYDQVFAFLPFQVSKTKVVAACYVMTQNWPTDMTPEKFSLYLTGLPEGKLAVAYYDPIADADLPCATLAVDGTGGVVVQLSAVDYPCLLTLEQQA